MERETMMQKENAAGHENHEQRKKEDFAREQGIMDKIKTEGFKNYAETLPNLAESFDLSKHQLDDFEHCICCMDGRLDKGIHSAGSTILLSPADRKTYMQVAQPDAISSHDGCGAGKIYCRAHGLPEENSDQIARELAEEIAKEYGLPHRHISAAEMKKNHVERVCYWDASGRINNDSDSGLPNGFVVSRGFMNKENCLAEAGVALDIIFGDHGFGRELFSADNPFIIAAVAGDENQLAEMQAEISELKHPYGDIVKIDGFIFKLPE